MKIAFKSNTKALLNGFSRVRAFQPQQKKILQCLFVKLDLYKDYLKLTCTGAALQGPVLKMILQRRKVSASLDHFYRILKSHGDKEITVSFENNKMTCQRRVFCSK